MQIPEFIVSASAEKKEEKIDKPIEKPAIEEPIKDEKKEDMIMPQFLESEESKEKTELEKPQ